DVHGSTALHYAARRGCSKCLAMLLEAVAPVVVSTAATAATLTAPYSPAEGGTTFTTAVLCRTLLCARNHGGRDVLAEARLSGDQATVQVVESWLRAPPVGVQSTEPPTTNAFTNKQRISSVKACVSTVAANHSRGSSHRARGSDGGCDSSDGGDRKNAVTPAASDSSYPESRSRSRSFSALDSKAVEVAASHGGSGNRDSFQADNGTDVGGESNGGDGGGGDGGQEHVVPPAAAAAATAIEAAVAAVAWDTEEEDAAAVRGFGDGGSGGSLRASTISDMSPQQLEPQDRQQPATTKQPAMKGAANQLDWKNVVVRRVKKSSASRHAGRASPPSAPKSFPLTCAHGRMQPPTSSSSSSSSSGGGGGGGGSEAPRRHHRKDASTQPGLVSELRSSRNSLENVSPQHSGTGRGERLPALPANSGARAQPPAENSATYLSTENPSVGTMTMTISTEQRQGGRVRRSGGPSPGRALGADRGQQLVLQGEEEREKKEGPAALTLTHLVDGVSDVSEPPATTAAATATTAWEMEALRLMQAALPAGSDLELHPSHLCGLGVSELSAAQLEGLDTLHRAALARISDARVALAVRVELERAEEDRQRYLEIRAIRDRDH
ncbi:hypothetical protein VaNZ11_017072, partial [Volvox africanus]